MDTKVQNFLKKHQISVFDIKYILREDGKTNIYTLQDRIFSTYIPMKAFEEFVGETDFIKISKGVLISAKQIRAIDKDSYYLLDGKVLHGRKNTPKQHRENFEEITTKLAGVDDSSPISMVVRLSLLDKMPAAFCVLQLVKKENGEDDLIFRYVNRAMELVEGRDPFLLLNQSLFQLYRGKQHIPTYIEIAKHGGSVVVKDYNYDHSKQLVISCYQPAEGYCACLIAVLSAVRDL